MNNKLERYKQYIFIGITIITMGVIFSTTMKDVSGSLGIVFIAVGGLFFIIGMNLKKEKDETKDK
jgi:predicted membrane channel-forming protein YqfA (hemolysin III family)